MRRAYKATRQRNTGFAVYLIRTPPHADVISRAIGVTMHKRTCNGNRTHAANEESRLDIDIEEANRNQPSTKDELRVEQTLIASKAALERLRRANC